MRDFNPIVIEERNITKHFLLRKWNSRTSPIVRFKSHSILASRLKPRTLHQIYKFYKSLNHL